MGSMLEQLADRNSWQEFLQSKIKGGNFSSYEEKRLTRFIENEEYLPIANAILQKQAFPLPKLVELTKPFSDKKRNVFVFDFKEKLVLKLLAHLLNRYDYLFSRNLFSFRKNIGVKYAIDTLVRRTRQSDYYSYKADIHDYFNSVDTDLIIRLLDETLTDDPDLNAFLQSVLTEPNCRKGKNVISFQKGIMAGVPFAGFLANLYLKDMDQWFEDQGILYARYSDDIIIFAKTEEEIKAHESAVKAFLIQKKLEINEKKEFRTLPGEEWEYLGVRILGKCVDISASSLKKIKDKMRRKARALIRWRERKNLDAERAVKAFIRHFNQKFYNNPQQNDITWCRWYFPIITTTESLRVIDEYMISCIRYIATGKHSKSNYNLRYERIKELGFRSLVNAYYKCKKTGKL